MAATASFVESLAAFVFSHVRVTPHSHSHGGHHHAHGHGQGLAGAGGAGSPWNSTAEGRECFWLPVTSSVDWCEKNCEFSPYVVEFFNTISNVAIMMPSIFGLWNCRREGLEKRFHFVHAMQVIVALGSIIFHGTLTAEGQFLDEYPMILAALGDFFVVVEAGKRPRPWMPFILGIYSAAVAAVILLNLNPIFFQASFVSVVLYIAYSCYRRLNTPQNAEDGAARRLFLATIGMWLAAGACWLIDYHACDVLESIPSSVRNVFQLHSYWHLLSGMAAFISAQFLAYHRLKDLGYKPMISYKYGLPYVQKTTRRVVKLD